MTGEAASTDEEGACKFDTLDELITDERYLAEWMWMKWDCIGNGCQNAFTSKKKPKACLDLKHLRIG